MAEQRSTHQRQQNRPHQVWWEKRYKIRLNQEKLLSRDSFKRCLLVPGFCRKIIDCQTEESVRSRWLIFSLLEQTLQRLYYIRQLLKIALGMKIFAVHVNINFRQNPRVAFKPKYCTHCILTIRSRLQQVYLYYIQGYKWDAYKKGGSVPLPRVWGSW